MDSPSTKPSTTQTIAEIRQWLGDRLSTAPAVREQHGKDQTWNPGAPPDAVAFVRSTEEVRVRIDDAWRLGLTADEQSRVVTLAGAPQVALGYR